MSIRTEVPRYVRHNVLYKTKHPVSILEILCYDHDFLITCYLVIIDYLEITPLRLWEEEDFDMMTTADRIAAVVSRRHGSLSIFGLEQAQLVFFQHAQQELHIHRPQPDIEIQQALTGVEVRQAPQELRIRHTPQEVEFRHAQPEVKTRNAPQEVEYRPAPQLEYRPVPQEMEVRQAQQEIRVQYAPQEVEIRYAPQSDTMTPPPRETLTQYQADPPVIPQVLAPVPTPMLPQSQSPVGIQSKASGAVLQQILMADSNDDSDDDSDEEDKRADPYELLGLRRREKTPVEDIEATHRVLGRIHRNSLHLESSEEKRKHANKRIYDIDWAVHILLDYELKRAYDDAGAIFPHEVDAWRMKKSEYKINR
jgi:hypothetical protein